MSDRSWLRAFGYLVLTVAWLLAIGAVGVLVATSFEVALEPPSENKLVGIVWVLFAPAVPALLVTSGGLLYWSWSQFRATHRRGARVALATLPACLLGIGVGFLGVFQLWAAVVMAVTVAAHLFAVAGMLVASIAAGRYPWNRDGAP